MNFGKRTIETVFGMYFLPLDPDPRKEISSGDLPKCRTRNPDMLCFLKKKKHHFNFTLFVKIL